jgi:hypothetical protein
MNQYRRIVDHEVEEPESFHVPSTKREQENELILDLAEKIINAGFRVLKAAGIRLLTAKGIRNDPMALMYFRLHGLNAKGIIAALEDRAVVEWKRGKLSKGAARRVVYRITQPVLPRHNQQVLGELMDLEE